MLALTTKVPGRNGPSPWAQAPHSVVLWTLNSMSSVPAPTGSMARLTEGTFGPKILGSVCISTICCLLMRAFCRKGPGGSLIPTVHCCPWPSGRCFLGTSCEPDHVLSMEAPSGRWLTQGHTAILPGGPSPEPRLLTSHCSAPREGRTQPCILYVRPGRVVRP